MSALDLQFDSYGPGSFGLLLLFVMRANRSASIPFQLIFGTASSPGSIVSLVEFAVLVRPAETAVEQHLPGGYQCSCPEQAFPDPGSLQSGLVYLVHTNRSPRSSIWSAMVGSNTTVSHGIVIVLVVARYSKLECPSCAYTHSSGHSAPARHP